MVDLHPFRPRLLDSLKSYDRSRLVHDIGAGISVGIVALPLAMAFAIASGVKPEQGIITAIVAGFLISALGGSSVQIGGPAGAFIVIVYGIVQRYGLTNLLIATALAGVLLFALGLLKLGALVRYVPVAVVIGFTNGIAVLIALSQLRDLFGLVVPGALPADFFGLLGTLAAHAGSVNLYALGIGAGHLRRTDGVATAVRRHAVAVGHDGGPHGAHVCPRARTGGGAGDDDGAGRGGSRCRWRRSARASAASRARCPIWRCRRSAGSLPSNC